MKTAFLYSDAFAQFDYGSTHPLKTFRLKLAYELISACGLLSLPNTRLVEAEAAANEDLLLFHDSRYIEVLESANNGIVTADAELLASDRVITPSFRVSSTGQGS